MIMTMIITTLIMTTMVFRSNSFLPFHSSALFSVDPLTSVRRSFQVKIIIIIVIIIITIIIIVIVIIINIIMIMMILQDIQAGVGRSMRSLMAAGSAIGHRMLGMITRAPSIIVIVILIIFILIIIMFLLIIRTALPCAPLVLLWPSPSGRIKI